MRAELPEPIIEERTGNVVVDLLKSPSEIPVSESSGNDFGTVSDGMSGKRRVGGRKEGHWEVVESDEG